MCAYNSTLNDDHHWCVHEDCTDSVTCYPSLEALKAHHATVHAESDSNSDSSDSDEDTASDPGLCIVFDIDGTMISECTEQIPGFEPDGAVAIQGIDIACIYKRPYIDALLDSLEQSGFQLAIWTKASREWADAVMRIAFPGRRWAFVWSGERCTKTVHREGMHSVAWKGHKSLKKIWKVKALRALGWRRENTLIIENTPANCVKNHGNSVIVSTFDMRQLSAAHRQ